jgi:hypothetical protein
VTDWAFYVATTDGDAIGELAAATGRKVTFRLDGAADASWSIDGRHPDAAVIDELTTDIYVRWADQTKARLRTGASSDDIDADAHGSAFAAVDYRGLLERRYTFTPLTYTAWDPTAAAADLIDYTQNRVALAGGNIGIDRGRLETIAGIDYVAPAGKQIAEAINDLSKLGIGLGFEWEISADLEFNVWSQRGAVRDFVAEYGSNVTAVHRSVDTSAYANTVRASGADGVTAATAAATDLATRPEGRIEMQDGNTDLTTAAQVAATAATDLARFGALTPSYTMTFAPGRWTPELLWLGDIATYVVQSGRLNIVAQDRVIEITVTLGDDGGETVDVTFGTRRQDLAAFLRRIPARLEALSRR